MAIRVAIADDSVLVLEGIQHVLAAQPGIEVVASCHDMPSLLQAVEAAQPDVVVSDIRMPPSRTDEGIQIAVRLRHLHPEVGVVILSQYTEPSYALKLLENGSDGRAYLLKERVSDSAQLVSAIEAVAAGGSVIDPKVVEALVVAQAPTASPSLAKLTPREQDVLAEIAQGKSNTAIAESLVLSKRAVEKHIHSIFFKLGLTDEEEVSRRVKAALLLLAEEATDVPEGLSATK
jgi:DNA-binding NarL/FixJ family response regulator